MKHHLTYPEAKPATRFFLAIERDRPVRIRGG